MASAVTLATGKFGNGVTPAFASGTASAANVFTAQGVGGAPPAVGSIASATVTQQVRTNAATRAGDGTLDKAVNGLDISRVIANFNGTSKLWQEGDVTGDLNVNGLDISRVIANFNQPPAVGAAAGVPEPASAALAMLALAGLAGLRKRA